MTHHRLKPTGPKRETSETTRETSERTRERERQARERQRRTRRARDEKTGEREMGGGGEHQKSWRPKGVPPVFKKTKQHLKHITSAPIPATPNIFFALHSRYTEDTPYRVWLTWTTHWSDEKDLIFKNQ